MAMHTAIMNCQEADIYAVCDGFYDLFHFNVPEFELFLTEAPNESFHQTTSASTSVSAFVSLNKPQFLQGSQRSQLPTGVVSPIPSSFHLKAPLFSDINASSERCCDSNMNAQFELLVTEAPNEGYTTSVSTPTSTTLSTPFPSPKIPQGLAFVSSDKPQIQELLQAPSSFRLGSPLFSDVNTSSQHYCAPANQSTVNNNSNDSSSAANTNVQEQGNTSTLVNTGGYTCTYHGCTRRFRTQRHLQKHKRHHQKDTSGGQAGPHKCERINPTTGEPCNTLFSRPYDLTRHEDTIHNTKKQKVRCAICVEDKKFSRNDALTRHMRVAHPEVDFPGKYRNRKT